MATAPEVAARWFRFAMGDLAAARALLADDRLPTREAAYLAQQAVEKAFKSTIALDGTEPPWTHDLLMLRQRAPEAVRNAAAGIDLIPLWSAASAARYPEGDDPPYDRDEVERLVSDAATIIEAVRRYLDAAGIGTSGLSAL